MIKAPARGLKTGKNLFNGFVNSRLWQSLIKYKITNRFAALLLITALLSPIFLLHLTRPVSAAPSLPIPQISAPISAPPESFTLSSPNYLSPAAAVAASAPVMALGAFVSNGYSSVAGYFTAPSIPSGFALAQPSSPFVASVSSIASSVSGFFGLAALTSRSVNTVRNNAASSAPVALPNALLSQPLGSVLFDFDGDGLADVARWHPSTKEWKVKRSSDGAYTTQTIGTSSAALIAPGDFDHDGKTDIAIFNAGAWTIIRSSDGATVTASLGASGDKPVVGDYDGDGVSDYAVFTPSTATWTIHNSINNSTTTTQFGAAGDLPVAGNYDGDYRTDIAVYRPSTGYWFVQGSTAGFSTTQWGNASDIPVPADYDGDGKIDKAVYRGSVGTWYVLQSSNGVTSSTQWGNYGDQPVTADYDRDGKADFAVWRPTTGVWHIVKSSTGAYVPQTLGVPGDTAVESAYLKQIGSQVYSYDFAKTRLSPKNSMGDTDLYSRNFSWSAGLVNLPGRAGLDAGLGISYNSLVWTKGDTTMVFDADKSTVSPGFRFGFPVIEPVYYNNPSFNYLMVTPSGAKVEFKQIGVTGTFETADSTYAQLKLNGLTTPNDPPENLTLTVTTTDGTQMKYSWIANAYRCTQIQDRNGNYITIYNDDYGLLKTITDTLHREITVNYDSDNNPISITQNWQTVNGSSTTTETHTYASFNYTSVAMSPSFDTSLAIYGPATGTIKGLQSISYPGGASTRFDYNVYGQVYKVSSNAADNHELNHTRINLANGDLTTGQTDCPRFTQTNNYAENFNLVNGVAQEVVVNNSVTPSVSYLLPDNLTRTGTKIEVSMPAHPNGAVSKTYVGGSGWQEGLPLATEDYADGVRKRWTQTTWTQDDVNQTYIVNPRVTETKVGDVSNTKRTVIGYQMQQGTDVSLANQVDVYDTDQSTVLKRQTTVFNINSAYLSRRIIGLPLESYLYQGPGTSLMSKVTYDYDEGDFSDTTLNQNLTLVTQHNHASRGYGSSFIIGRGNMTSMTRWDVTGATSSIVSKLKYNTAGAVVAQLTPDSNSVDPSNPTRTVKIGYTDSFNDNDNTRNTFAYPTTLTDPAGFSSQVKYRFDIGVNVWAQSPAPQNQMQGKTSERIFDTVGRLERQKIANYGGAYTRYEYPSNGVQSKVYSTITDTNSSGAADAADEVLSESWTDGAGRVRQARSVMPNSTGGYSGTKTEYDILGRVSRASVPTELDFNWNPAGDDYTRGFLWTSQTYDWKGRVTQETNTDGTFKTIGYDGCGCAGGQVITIQGENIVESDWQNNNQTPLGRRTQKIYADILGRTKKTEVMNWNGTTPYATTVNTYNGRDQVTQTKQYAGVEGSSSFQEMIMIYDGFGRVKNTHRPEQDTNKFTTYNYFADDTLQTVTDARGSSANYSYNSRGLVENVNYTVPINSSISVPQPINFIYDNAGNPIQMVDETGTTSYQYDQLSQLTSETKQFNGITNSFTLSYEYTLSGQLKQMTNPGGTSTSYVFDKIGRLTTVNGQGYVHKAITWNGGTSTTTTNNINQIVQTIEYRAWGGIKHAEFPDNIQYNITYNNKLKPEEYRMPGKIEKRYTYTADGNLSFAQDFLDKRNDRSFSYDHIERMVKAYGGFFARGEPRNDSSPNQYDWFIPVKNDYVYNAFSNPTSRKEQSGMYQSEVFDVNLVKNYTNNRVDGWIYDADGRFVEETLPNVRSNKIEFNAAGQTSKTKVDVGDIDVKSSFYDGNGIPVKESMFSSYTTYDQNGFPLPPIENTSNRYYLKSTVLGGAVVCLIYENGSVGQTNVYAGGKKIATYTPNGERSNKFIWDHTDSNGISSYKASFDRKQFYPAFPNDDLMLPGKADYDPHGQEIGGLPSMSDLTSGGGGGSGGSGSSRGEVGGGWETFDCVWDGVNVPCGWVNGLEGQNSGGAVVQAPSSNTAAIWSNSRNRFVGLAVWSPAAAERGIAFLGRGSLGWLPTNVSYTPGAGLSGDNVYQWFGGWTGNRLEAPNFISEKSAQIYSMFQGIGNNWNNFAQFQQQTKQKDPASLAPKGYASDKKLTAEECDKRLAQIFGGQNAIVGSTKDPLTLAHFDNLKKSYNGNLPAMHDGSRSLGHGPAPYPEGFGVDKGGIIHIYAESRSVSTGPLYAPAGGKVSPIGIDSLGNQYRRASYSTGLTITFVHTAPSKENDTNELGSVRIGNIGGAGGGPNDSPDYVHSHLVFFSNFAKRERVDPRQVFCGW